ncbi:MAG TPA: hypothetical protein PLF56_05735 [Micropruina sp.]|nr:hypothetical protein [Micropruina sp.]
MTGPLDPLARVFDHPPKQDFTDTELEIKAPMDYAADVEAVEKAMLPMDQHLGRRRRRRSR